MKNKKRIREVYLDYAASTPLDPRVLKAMQPFFTAQYGNPSSLHSMGVFAKSALEKARSDIAKSIAAKPSEIIFTAGGTESINLALLGTVLAFKDKNKIKPLIVTTIIEHQAVLSCMDELKKQGCSVDYLNVDQNGFINFKTLEQKIEKETILLSVIYANNEIGVIQPILKIGKWLKGVNFHRHKKGLPNIYLHIDACQAAGFLDINVTRLGVDLMSVNGSKIYGPKQTGFLYVRTGVNIKPIIYGGGQEKNLRSGTENIAGAVGIATALTLVLKNQKKENARLSHLRDWFIKEVKHKIPGVKLNGPEINRLPNNINLEFPKLDAEALMYYLDAKGIYVTTASACSTAETGPSHVLLALGKTEPQASSSLRFTLGQKTTQTQLKSVIESLIEIIKIIS